MSNASSIALIATQLETIRRQAKDLVQKEAALTECLTRLTAAQNEIARLTTRVDGLLRANSDLVGENRKLKAGA